MAGIYQESSNGQIQDVHVAVPDLSLALHTIPKNGGTSLLELAWQLKTGAQFPDELFGKNGIYSAKAVRFLWGTAISNPHRRLVVFRDPVDRAVSLYRRGLKYGYFSGHTLESVLENHEDWVNRNEDYAHHAISQRERVNARPLSDFTHIVPFARFHEVFDLLEEWSGVNLPYLHREKAETPMPEVSARVRERVQEIWREDYEHGIAKAAKAPSIIVRKSVATSQLRMSAETSPPCRRILLMGMPRSHTSVLSTSIATGIDAPMLFEPFHPGRGSYPRMFEKFSTQQDRWQAWERGSKRRWMRQFDRTWVLKSLYMHTPRLGFVLADLCDRILLTRRDPLEVCCSIAISRARHIWARREAENESLPPVEVSHELFDEFVGKYQQAIRIQTELLMAFPGKALLLPSSLAAARQSIEKKLGITLGNPTTERVRKQSPLELVTNVQELSGWFEEEGIPSRFQSWDKG